MQLFATIGSVNSLKEELASLMGFIPSKKVNRFDRSEQLLEIRKPTVACRLNLSLIFWLASHYSRLANGQTPKPGGKEILYD